LTSELVREQYTFTDKNARDADALIEWLRSKGVDDAPEVILVVLQEQGFVILQIGPVFYSKEEQSEILGWVSEQMADAMRVASG
jgi:hypothetical protein